MFHSGCCSFSYFFFYFRCTLSLNFHSIRFGLPFYGNVKLCMLGDRQDMMSAMKKRKMHWKKFLISLRLNRTAVAVEEEKKFYHALEHWTCLCVVIIFSNIRGTGNSYLLFSFDWFDMDWSSNGSIRAKIKMIVFNTFSSHSVFRFVIQRENEKKSTLRCGLFGIWYVFRNGDAVWWWWWWWCDFGYNAAVRMQKWNA